MPKYFKLIFFVVLCNLAGILGAMFTFSAIPNWYAYLEKPFFNPPNYLFGPVWTTLYTLMGISVFMVCSTKASKKILKTASNIFWTQLFLNAIWTPIFFGYKNLGLAFVVIVLLWIFIIKTIQVFSKINKTASYLLYPYLVWVSFASILNFSIWYLN